MKLSHIIATTLAQSHLTLKLASISNGVHHSINQSIIKYLVKQIIHILCFIDPSFIKVTQ